MRKQESERGLSLRRIRAAARARGPLRFTALSLAMTATGLFAVIVGDAAPTSASLAAPPGVAPNVVVGQFDNDPYADVALVGGALSRVPVLTNAAWNRTVHDAPSGSFSNWAAEPGVQTVSGQFNKDALTDVALVGGSGRTTIPVAAANGDGTFKVTNTANASFAALAQQSNAHAVAGDFNKDGLTDIALVGGTGWTSVPVALSNGDGSFKVVNPTLPVTDFGGWASVPGVRILPGDFDGNGATDIALVPPPNTSWWYTLPVAFSNGDGTFRVTNTQPGGNFTSVLAQTARVQVVTGVFNNDNKTDIALVGGPGWPGIPVALSVGDGTFNVVNPPTTQPDYNNWANVPGARVIAGDFNGDGFTDIAELPPPNTTWWISIPIAFSKHDGTFYVTTEVGDQWQQQFTSFWAQEPGLQVTAADFNDDGLTDFMLTGGVDLAPSLVIAYSLGDGTFNVTNAFTWGFSLWSMNNATPAGTTLIAGTPPTLTSATAAGTSVTLQWTDRSTTEDVFDVFRRDPNSQTLQFVKEISTTDRAGTGKTYSFTDTITAGVTECYEIGVDDSASVGFTQSNDVCTASQALPTPQAAGVGAITTVDTDGNSGIMPAMTTGADGLGIVSYASNDPAVGNNRLLVSHCSDAACTSVVTHKIDTTADVGWFSSIKIGADGLPLISYQSYRTADHTAYTNDLKVAHCVDVVCSSATITTLDTASTVDARTSLSIGADGLGLIVYQNESGSQAVVKAAHCANAACTSATYRTLDTIGINGGGFYGPETVTVSPSGTAYIAYADPTSKTLRLNICDVTTADCHLFTPVDKNYGIGFSLAFGRDGLPLISYQGNSTSSGSDLVVRHCANVYCTSSTTATVHTGAFTGWTPSLAIGADGFGVVAFSDYTNKDLVVAHCSNVACTSLTTNPVDEFGKVAANSLGIAIGADGLPMIAFSDGDNVDLKVAHCGDVACSTELVVPF